MGLQDCRVGVAVPVSDMATAKEFYEGKLGLTGGEEGGDGGVTYVCGGGSLMHVYPSPSNAGKSGATLAGFRSADVEASVDELAASGVEFESYDMAQLKTNEKGIAQIGDVTSAWFKDPDGNVLGITDENA
jgi:catechol 2,3-dioxygenase-like lactoylglutathione lyase family enzyme